MIVRIKKMLERTVWALTRSWRREISGRLPMRSASGAERSTRIDTCAGEDKVYVKVVDYKTGKKAFDVTALYHGLQLQLMVYLDAAVQMAEKRYPGCDSDPCRRILLPDR